MGVPQPGRRKDGIVSLKRAMHPKYDRFFAKFPKVAFKECMMHQDVGNEKPFYPPLPETGALRQWYRNRTDNYQSEGEGATATSRIPDSSEPGSGDM
ncbi:hypothetical protein DL764_010561 [Monosporascus ibericus]|uniref:Uncharacterized protein n=1 Tax=Monosporascus ibericus TaxID=155417 RepID=A0A4Q4SSI7_9PEZI|nr:hypothetical protein DL764_010561 [Monosporascus ibericus]